MSDTATNPPETTQTTPPPEAPESDVLDTGTDDGAQTLPDGDLLSGDEGTNQEGVPDQYTFEAPEGVDVNDDTQAGIDKFMEAAREMGLSQDQFQAVVQYDLSRAQDTATAAVDAWNTKVQGWKADALADKDIGGDNFKTTVSEANAALAKFGSPGLMQILRSPSDQNPNGLAINNHPEVLRMLAKVGRALAEPVPLEGEGEQAGEDALKRMYPSMFKDA